MEKALKMMGNDEKKIVQLEQSLHTAEMATRALEESEKRYRRLFESAKDGILILDAETGRIVDANPFLLELLGYSSDEMRGEHIWDLGAFKDIAASQDAFRTLQDSEYIRYEDLPLETRDGRPVSVEFISNVYRVDDVKVIQCNIRDITARKHAEAEHTRLMAAVQQTGEAMVMTDAWGNISFVNHAFEQMTGYGHDEVVGQNLRILKSGEHDDRIYANIWETISGGKTWEGRLVNQRRDGVLYTAESTVSPVRNAAGQIVNYVAVSRDITDHLLLTARFQQAQKMEAVGLLAGGVAHDFNNMLSVILGNVELAMEKAGAAGPLSTHLKEIRNAAMRSAELTRQLLTFARKRDSAPVSLDLNRDVEGMLRMLRHLIGENIKLDWQPGPDLWPVMMDPGHVSQILANLCVNARDAIKDVGRITIATANETHAGETTAGAVGATPGDYVVLTVTDDGSGMTPEVLEQIFEPFYTSKAKGRGTGLGLSTVYGMVAQDDGHIEVTSEPDKGTTFSIHLRRHLGRAAASGRADEAEAPRSRGETVLVVEDEPALLELTGLMLTRLGYQVLVADTPGNALKLAAEHKADIDLLLTDVVMPEMNGRNLATRLQGDNPSLRILFMSGYTADVILNRNVHEADAEFLHKPFTSMELATMVRAAIDHGA